MLDTAAIEKTYEGTWKEVLSRRDEIPETSRVEVRVLDPRIGEEERSRLQKVVNDFLSAVSQIAEKESRPAEEVGARIAEELLRESRFPGIEFRDIGRKRLACVKGRIEVWQVMMVARNYGDDIQGIADHLVLLPDQVKEALAYYAAYPDEIDSMLALNDSMTYEEMKRRYPWMKIGCSEIADAELAAIDDATL